MMEIADQKQALFMITLILQSIFIKSYDFEFIFAANSIENSD